MPTDVQAEPGRGGEAFMAVWPLALKPFVADVVIIIRSNKKNCLSIFLKRSHFALNFCLTIGNERHLENPVLGSFCGQWDLATRASQTDGRSQVAKVGKLQLISFNYMLRSLFRINTVRK